MSTRSQIRFVEERTYEDNDGNERTSHIAAQVYRHSDGYPESVLPDLAQLKAIQDATGTHRDPSYVAANYIFLMKFRGMGFYVGREPIGGGPEFTMDDIESALSERDFSGFENLVQPHFLLGHGVEDVGGIHGDEEYLYIVDTTDGWEVRVSEHFGFPTWDDETEDAFDDASWEYVGPLEDALAAHA